MLNNLSRDLRLIRIGVRGELRNPALRLLAVLLAVGAGAYAWKNGPLAGSTAIFLSTWGGRVFALAACLWFATGALRDQNPQLGAVLRSKPIDGAHWVWVTWATGIGLWLVLLGSFFLGAMLGQLPHAGLHSVAAHTLGFLRAASTMIPVATVGFALSRLSRSPLGATIVVLAFLCVLAGLQLVPPFLRPDYTQNLGLYVGAAGFLLALTGLLVERFRRGELRRPALPALGVAAVALLTCAGAGHAYRTSLPPAEGSVLDLMERQYLEVDRQVPGFWLPDGRGGRVSTGAYAGKVLVIYLFDPGDLESAPTLRALDQLQREFGARGVQALGIAFSTDRGDTPALNWTAGHRFPIGYDPTTTKGGPSPEAGLATAYALKTVPSLVVTDRRRIARDVQSDYAYSIDVLRKLVERRLTEEAE